MSWNRLTELKNNGKTYNEIADVLNNEFDERFTGSRVRGWWRRNGDIPVQKSVNITDLLQRGATLQEITEKTQLSERVSLAMIEDLRDKGLCVEENDGI